MAKGLLVSYGGYPYTLASLFPDNGLASLAAVLRREGHFCEILDYNTAEVMSRLVDDKDRRTLSSLFPRVQEPPDSETIRTLLAVSNRIEERGGELALEIARQLVDRCNAESIDFVGFKLWSGDGFEASIRIANYLRDRSPGVKLFAGGPAVHYGGHVVHEEAPVFDAVINGDGEEAILELARYTEGKRPLDGIPNMAGTGLEDTVLSDLSSLPLLEYRPDVYPAIRDGGKIKLLCVDESRGCPMQCGFCINRCIGGGKWRARSAEVVLAQIKAFKQRWGSRGFRLTGSYCPPKLTRSICKAILAENLDVIFGLSLHASGVNDELLSDLRAAGCHSVFYGVESGSDEILKKSINKLTSVATLRDVVGSTVRAGLFTCASFILPAPFETEHTKEQTRRFVKELFVGKTNTSVIINFPGLIPGTAWWNERQNYGFELDVPDDIYRREVLKYKILHILPPTLWKSLPYRLNGKTFADVCSEAATFRKWVHKQGIVANLPDHDALIGELLGKSPRAIQEMLMQTFFTGDGEGLQRFVDDANKALCS